MKVTVFSTKPYDEQFFKANNPPFGHEIEFIENRLKPETAHLALGAPAVCAFVNDVLDAATMERLHRGGTRFI
ncbi:MAG: 2-hydroxyacid dehydrogenase, partial [Luteolibacter sp.]